MTYLTKQHSHRGLTLFEILTVIAIMSVLVAIMIPQMRTISKDRQVRESARVVNSLFNDAIQRARTDDGQAGVLLVRNPNIAKQIPDGMGGFRTTSVASSTLFRLRAVDPYSGFDVGETMQFHYRAAETRWVMDIEVPLQNDVIQLGDLVHIDMYPGSPGPEVNARITDIEGVPAIGTPNFTRLTLDIRDNMGNVILPGSPGAPEQTDEVTTGGPAWMIVNDLGSPPFEDLRVWEVQRLPRIVQSSRLDLPDGYFIALEHSGFGPAAADEFSQLLNPAMVSDEGIVIEFDQTSGIQRMIGQYGSAEFEPFDSLHLLVGQYNPDSNDPSTYVLNQEESLWVSIHHIWGSTNVSNHSPNPVGANYAERILDARKFTRSRSSARQ